MARPSGDQAGQLPRRSTRSTRPSPRTTVNLPRRTKTTREPFGESAGSIPAATGRRPEPSAFMTEICAGLDAESTATKASLRPSADQLGCE
jgi:hypothetical protein